MSKLAAGLLTLALVAPPLGGGRARAETPAPTIAFARLVTRLGPDEGTWTIGHGVLCLPSFGLGRRHDGARVKAGRENVTDKGFEDAFRSYVERAGLKVEGDPDDLFKQAPHTSARFVVAGAITGIRAKLCRGGYDASTIKGSATVDVEWQLYDRTTKTVRAKVTTSGMFATDRFGHDNDRFILYNAVGDSARALVEGEVFRAETAR